MAFDRETSSVFLGNSKAAERLRLQVQRFAPHFRTVLLAGEPGSGKQSVARELYRLSPAAAEPFEGLTAEQFVQDPDSYGGTIYLVGLKGASAQLQESVSRRLGALGRETRLIVACEGEPRALLACGRLSAEVLERGGMLEIQVPPLRERLEDFEAMTGHMLEQMASPARWGRAELDAAYRHGWPGNLAELRRACERFAACGELVLEGAPREAQVGPLKLDEVIERHVMEVLERCAGNKLKAAELLGISRSTLYRMLEAAG